MKTISSLFNLIGYILLGLTLYLSFSTEETLVEQISQVEIYDIELVPSSKDPHLQEVWETIQKVSTLPGYPIYFRDVLYSQIIHETDSLRSNVCRECINYTGMRHNSRGLSIRECRYHAQYKSLEDCIKDYSLWQQARFKYYRTKYNKLPKNAKEYISFLVQMNYAEDKSYKRHILRWYDKIFSN